MPDREALLERMLKRAAEEGRSDDTPEAIGRRLALYDEQTAPLVEYYRSTRGNVVGIHAERADRRGLRRDPPDPRRPGDAVIGR